MKKLLTRVNDTQKNEKGFTLIELIVVIAIIGILALIVVPRLGAFQENARQSGDQQVAAVYANATLALIAKYPDISEISAGQITTIPSPAAGTPSGDLEQQLIANDLLNTGDLTLRSRAYRDNNTTIKTQLNYNGTNVVVTLNAKAGVKGATNYTITK